MKKIIATVITTLHCMFLSASSGTLIVGTNAEFPPYSYIDQGKIVGFDIDIAKEVAHRLDKEITLKDLPFEALIPDVILGRVDFVAAGMSYTEERAKRVFFTRSYLGADPLVIFSIGAEPIYFDNLKGKKIVVVEGFTADILMSSVEGVHLTRLPTQADAFMAVKAGRADAFVTAETTVRSFLETQDIKQYKSTPIPGTAETCALVVPKSKPELFEKIQTALDDMEKDGKLAEIKAKWKLK